MTDPTGLHRGDAATTLATWPDHCAQACVTSPPYLQQRRYGDSDLEGGLQETLFDYIEWLATTLAQVRRVLRPDGLLWCNIGDKANNSGGAGGDWTSDRKRRTSGAGPGKFHDKAWPAQSFLDVPGALIAELLTDGWRLRADIIWDKGRDAPEDLAHIGRPRVSHERILLFAPTAERPRWYPSMLTETGSVWHFPPGGSGPAHLAPFPDELARRCILPSTLPGDLVIDPFHGSGTTGRIATQLGRRYAGIDLYAEAPESGTETKRRHVDLKDLHAIGLKAAVLYRAANQLAEGQTLDQVTAEHRLTPEQVAYLDEMTRPQEALAP